MIATEKGDAERFTPASLVNLSEPPVFTLRPATGREMRDYRRQMQLEGLAFHGKEELRDELLRAIRNLYSPDLFTAYEGRLRSYWALMDQKGALDPAETEAISDLSVRVSRVWRPYREMLVDNEEFRERSLLIAVSMFLTGWSGVDLSYRREAGCTPVELVETLAQKLKEIEEQAAKDKVEGVVPGLGFLQLCLAAQRHLGLQVDEEKNSDTPPSSPSDLNGSTTLQSAPTAAAPSKASASSGSTRKGGSAKSRAKAATRG